MSKIQSELTELFAEWVFDDNVNKDNKRNIRDKFNRIYNGKELFQFRDQSQGTKFLDGICNLYAEFKDYQDKIFQVKKQNKKLISDNKLSQYHYDKTLEQSIVIDELKEKLKHLETDKIKEYDSHPYCMGLLQKMNELENQKNRALMERNNSVKEMEKMREENKNKAIEYAEYITDETDRWEKRKNKIRKDVEKEFKQLSNHNEKELTKTLKEQIKRLQKKNLNLKKINNKLMMKCAELSSDSDAEFSDSD